MKKLITVSSVLAVLAGSSAYAKTEGSYLGIDFIRSTAESKYKNANGTVNTNLGKFHDRASGFGFNYKYAYNLGGDVFIAPGVFYDKIGTSAQDKDSDPVNVFNRYGAKLDIGYDINDKVAVYFTNGFAKTRYQVDWTGSEAGSHSGTTPMNYFRGVGASMKVAQNVLVNVEYNTHHISLASPTEGVTARTKLDVAKIGLSLKF